MLPTLATSNTFFRVLAIFNLFASLTSVHAATSYANDFVDPDYILAKDYGSSGSPAKLTIAGWARELAAKGPWIGGRTAARPETQPHNSALCPMVIVWTTCRYISRDGIFNPDARLVVNDVGAFQDLSDAVLYNAIAWALSNATSNEYSKNVVNFVNTWFLDETTGMLPNLDYAQQIRGPGDPKGSHTGVLAGNCRPCHRRGPFHQQSWIFLLQSARGPSSVASASQPLEAARTRPYHYRAYNLAAMITNARIGIYAAPDAPSPFQFKTSQGATIQSALDFAITFKASDSKEDNYASELNPNVAAVAAEYGDPDGKYAGYLKVNEPDYPAEAWFLWNQPLSDSGLSAQASMSGVASGPEPTTSTRPSTGASDNGGVSVRNGGVAAILLGFLSASIALW